MTSGKALGSLADLANTVASGHGMRTSSSMTATESW
jgi:hypothetical protein